MLEQLLLNLNKSIIEMEIISFEMLDDVNTYEVIKHFKSSWELTVDVMGETLGETTNYPKLFKSAHNLGIIENCNSWMSVITDYRLLATYEDKVDISKLMFRIFTNHIHTLKSVMDNVQQYSNTYLKIA